MERRVLHRRRSLVPGAVRLPGAVRAAAAAAASRFSRTTPRPDAAPSRRGAGSHASGCARARASQRRAALTSEPSEREIVVETATVQAVLSNRGGRMLHWRLKEYRDGAGQPVDLVPVGLARRRSRRPFSLRVDDEALTRRLNTALYRVTGDTSGRVDATSHAGDAGLRVPGRRRPPRAQGVPLRPAELRRRLLRDGHERRHAAATPRSSGGPASATPAQRPAAAASSPATTCSRRRRSSHRDGDVERMLPDAAAGATGPRRAVPLRRHRRSLLHRGGREPWPGAGRVPPGHAARRRRDAAPAAGSDLPFAAAARRTRGSSSARSSSSCCAPSTPSWCARSTSASSRGSPCRCSAR